MEKDLSKNPFYLWIKWRIKKNKNVIIVVNGSTGSGKTFAAATIAENISRMFGVNFSVKTNLDFNFTGLLKKMMLPENEGAGVPYLFEEVGVVGGGASSREWQSKANRLFFSFMQTARHRNQILILTTPHFTFLEKGTRSLVHLQLTTKGIDFGKKVCYLRPYFLQVNPTSGKIYFKFLRYRKEGVRYKLTQLEVAHPSDKFVKDYEEMKARFTTKLSESIVKEEDNKKQLTDTQAMVYNLHKEGKNVPQISDELGIGQSTIYFHLKACEKKGYEV